MTRMHGISVCLVALVVVTIAFVAMATPVVTLAGNPITCC